MNVPPDQADRDRIRDDLAHNLFVEAGAGAGKTTSLVGRIVELVRSGVPIGGIAAITFTEKAAGELRHKLRLALQAEADGGLFDLDRGRDARPGSPVSLARLGAPGTRGPRVSQQGRIGNWL